MSLYRVVSITNNTLEYPDSARDTADYPDLIAEVEDEEEMFVINLETGEHYPADDFFRMVENVTHFETESRYDRQVVRIPNLVHRIELLNEELKGTEVDYKSLLGSVSPYQFKAYQFDSLVEAIRELDAALDAPWWKRRRAIRDAIDNLRYLYEKI